MPRQPPSHTYDFDVGAGTWAGTFTFNVTSGRESGRASVGLKNLLLVAAMRLTQRIVGPSDLTSVVVPQPEHGELGVVDSTVRLGSPWTATYQVGADRASLAGKPTCSWAEADEQATKRSS